MNRIAYTTFIAFVASILTLLAVKALTSETDSVADDGQVITLDELAEHDSTDSCWKAIDGRVYDITSYIPNHPTPEEVIADWCGQESTDAWEGIGGGRGHSAGAESQLANYQIGVLEGHEDLLSTEPEDADAQPVADTQVSRSNSDGAAAAGNLSDGSYYGELAPDERGWIPLMEITIKGGRILGVHYDEVQRNDDGEVTDQKLNNYGYAERWRNAVPGGISVLSAFPAYGEQLRMTGDAAAVDGFSGATSTHDTFKGLATQLLEEASAE